MVKRLLLLTSSIILLTTACGRFRQINYEELTGKVREILEVPTFEQVYRDIIYYGEEKKLLAIKIVDKRLLFSMDVVVKAGIDFTEGLEVLPGDNAEAVTLVLPHAKILLIDADEASIHQYFVKNRGGDITLLDYYNEIDRTKERIRQDALNRGILFKAEENAVKLLRKFFGFAGFTDVEFEFKESGAAP